MSWGTEYGVTPWGNGGSGMQLLSADAVRENVIRLTFDLPVYFSRWHDPSDASFIDRYTVTADATAIGIDGNPSRPVLPADVQPVPGDGSQIDLWLDRAMSPCGSKYNVSVVGLVSTMGVQIAVGANTATVDGVQQGFPVLTPDKLVGNRDIANPQMLGAFNGLAATTAGLGVYQYDDTGDLGIDEGLISYKKRIFRRLTTRKGAYKHLPNYGVTIPQSVKKLARANLVDGIAADAEDQIRQEPETTSVSVRLVPDPLHPGLFVYQINAQATLGPLSGYNVPVPVGV